VSGEQKPWLWRFCFAALFVFSLGAPQVSVVAAAMGFVAAYRRPAVFLRPNVAITTALLIAFTSWYFGVMYVDSYVEFRIACREVALITLLYCFGVLVGTTTETSDSTLLQAIIMVAAGFVVTAFLSVNQVDVADRALGITARAAPSYWEPDGEGLTGTGFGLSSILALSLLPPVLFTLRARPRSLEWTIIRLAMLSLAAAGIYINVELQNRGPFMALIVATSTTAIVFWRSAHSPLGRALRISGVILAAVASTYLLADLDSFATTLGIARRFTEYGVDSGGRTQAWMNILTGIWSHPWGGREIDLAGLNYAHNLWLDVAYDAGLIPAMLLVTFHAAHVRRLMKLSKRGLSPLLLLVLTATSAAFLTIAVGEPVLNASVPLFGATCFIFGAIASVPIPKAVPEFATANRRWRNGTH
jgi:hypothetical protein